METRLARLCAGAFCEPGDPVLISLPGPAWLRVQGNPPPWPIVKTPGRPRESRPLFAVDEGFELNVLGLNIGIDAAPPALKLPPIGRLGADC